MEGRYRAHGEATSSRVPQMALCAYLGVERDVLPWCGGILHVAQCATSPIAWQCARRRRIRAFERGALSAGLEPNAGSRLRGIMGHAAMLRARLYRPWRPP